jgi:uncharacterized protein YbjQ (UPF0145 family)
MCNLKGTILKRTMMYKLVFGLAINFLIIGPAAARDTISDYSIADAMADENIKVVLGDSISFHFGEVIHGKLMRSIGEFTSNKKTNAFNKTDTEACEWAFASAMKSLRDRAIKEGGNAVINIRSNYKGNLSSSETTFRCGAGSIMAGVALTGTVAELEN